jgi:enterochelin esterase-like enzyme
MLRLLFVLILLGPTAFAQIQDLTYPSALNNQAIPIKVYLPPGYETGTQRYPVVYNLHGAGGSPERQWDRTRATLTEAMDARRVRPMIYVFVNGLGNTHFVNTATGKQIERSIVTELIPFIDRTYRTIANRTGRAIDGFSMGGFGCLSVAFKNPGLFGTVTSYGAALVIGPKGENYRDPAHHAEHDPWALVRKNADAVRKQVRVRMVCGDADGLYGSNVKFKAVLDSLNIPVDWVSVPGVAHNTQGLFEATGLESLHFFEESFDLAAKGKAMNVPVKRKPAAIQRVAGVALGAEPAPFRPSGPLPRLKVSADGHSFVTETGQPFFWLGDTAWLLFQNLDREGVDKYLEDRASKGFSAVLAHILPWHQGEKNAAGETAFVGNDWSKPNETYWAYCDHVVAQAAAKGLYLGVLPMWTRNYINRKGEPNAPPLLDEKAAYAYGKFLGKRYAAQKHVIWVLGGDAEPKFEDIHDALAKGLAEGAGGLDQTLMTYHPKGTPESSATWFHDRDWLDFNLIQSSHKVWKLNYEDIARAYARRPAKPVLEGEPCYENHPIAHRPDSGYFNAWHVRTKAYWSVFAGGAGFVYGGNGIWQMDRAGQPPHRATHFTQTWDKALDLPGAGQMKYLRRLIESRPFLSRIPDDGTVLGSPAGTRADRIQVTRGADRSWAMYYLTTGQPVQASLANLTGPQLNAWWFNPRDGKTYGADGTASDRPFAEVNIADKKARFDPPGEPGEGNDWVLVLDNARLNFPPPGRFP